MLTRKNVFQFMTGKKNGPKTENSTEYFGKVSKETITEPVPIVIPKGGDSRETLMEKEADEYEIVEKEILPEKMICPDCGGITLAGLDFCDKCGGELANYENY